MNAAMKNYQTTRTEMIELEVVKDALYKGELDHHTPEKLMKIAQNLRNTYQHLPETVSDLIQDQYVEMVNQLELKVEENASRMYVASVAKDLAAGTFDNYTLKQITELEEKVISVYSLLSDKDKESQQDAALDVVYELGRLQLNTSEGVVGQVLAQYNPKDFQSYADGKYKRPEARIILEDSIDVHADVNLLGGQGSVELLLDNLPVAPAAEIIPGKKYPIASMRAPESNRTVLADGDFQIVEEIEPEPVTVRRPYHSVSSSGESKFSAHGSYTMKKRDTAARELAQEIDLLSFLPKVMLYNPADDTPEIEVEEIEVDLAELEADLEENAPATQRSVAYIPGTTVTDVFDIDFDALDRQLGYEPVAAESSVVAPVEAPQKTLENIVAIAPAKSKNKAVGYIAAAAIALAGTLAGLYTGFTHIYSSLKNTADVAHSENQGTPSVQSAAPVKNAKVAVTSEPKKAEKEVSSPEAQKNTPAPATEKKVKRIPPRPTTYSGSGTHTIQSGDTVFYHLCAGDVKCAKEMWRINPGVDLNNLYPGQKLNMISGSYDTILSQNMEAVKVLGCETVHDLNKIGDVDGMAGKLKPIRDNLSRIGVELDYLNCKANASK